MERHLFAPIDPIRNQTRRQFVDDVLATVEREFGTDAKRRAERQLADADVCDLFGVAVRNSIPCRPTPRFVRQTAALWGAKNGFYAGTTDPAVVR